MNQQRKKPLTLRNVLLVSGALAFALLIVMAIALRAGTANITMEQVFSLFSNEFRTGDPAGLILFRIRLPRILLAGMVGFALSLSGVVFQALLRNPLADPFILGVSSGSAFGAVIAIVFGFSFRIGVPFLAFLGALLAITMLITLGSRKMGMESSTILLTGVIINAFFTALIMFFVSTSADSQLYSMLFWLYGDLAQSKYDSLAIMSPFVFAGAAIMYGYARHMNLLTAGEETARQLGVDVERTKKICLIIVSLIIGLIVSFSGLIGFVGLIIPHLGRMAFGSDHRLLIPTASLGGAIFLVAADTLARTIISPSELPVGVITAFLGAPFFIYLLKTRGSQWGRS